MIHKLCNWLKKHYLILNRNYDAEVFAFARRLNEKFNDNLLRQAFVDPSFTASEKIRLKDLG